MEISEDYYFIPYYFYFENTNVTVVTEWIQITETFRLLVEFLSLLSVPYLHPSLRKRRDETCSPVPFTGLGLPWIGHQFWQRRLLQSRLVGFWFRRCTRSSGVLVRFWLWVSPSSGDDVGVSPGFSRLQFFLRFLGFCSNQLPVSTIDCFFLPRVRLMHLWAFFNH